MFPQLKGYNRAKREYQQSLVWKAEIAARERSKALQLLRPEYTRAPHPLPQDKETVAEVTSAGEQTAAPGQEREGKETIPRGPGPAPGGV